MIEHHFNGLFSAGDMELVLYIETRDPVPMEQTTAYKAGLAAGALGLPESANPYGPRMTRSIAKFKLGWSAGRIQYEDASNTN